MYPPSLSPSRYHLIVNPLRYLFNINSSRYQLRINPTRHQLSINSSRHHLSINPAWFHPSINYFNMNSHSQYRSSGCSSGGQTKQLTSISELNSFTKFLKKPQRTGLQLNSPKPFLILIC